MRKIDDAVESIQKALEIFDNAPAEDNDKKDAS